MGTLSSGVRAVCAECGWDRRQRYRLPGRRELSRWCGVGPWGASMRRRGGGES